MDTKIKLFNFKKKLKDLKLKIKNIEMDLIQMIYQK